MNIGEAKMTMCKEKKIVVKVQQIMNRISRKVLNFFFEKYIKHSRIK